MLPLMIRAALLRELAALRREVEAYPDEAQLWALPPGLPNAGGTLALHLAGNLRHYVGAWLGGTGYVRRRDLEFSARDVPRADVLAAIDEAAAVVDRTLAGFPERRLDEPFPEPIRPGTTLNTADLLLQLAVHAAYHLGQVSYHRRLVSGDPTGVDALNPGALLSAGAE